MRRLLRNPANETPLPAETLPPAVRPYIPCTGVILQGVAVEPTMESYGWNIRIKNCTWPHKGSEFGHLGTPIGDLAQFAVYGPVTPQPPHSHLRGLRDLSSARRLQLLSHGVRVLHDIDDTIVCSGGSHFKGIDKKCAGTKEKHLYPGVVELFYALSLGPSSAAVWGEAAANYTVPFSARPWVLFYLLAARQCSGEDLRFRQKICGCAGGSAGCKRKDADCGCFGIATELAQYGHLRDGTDFVNQRFKRLGRTKFGNWYSNIYGHLGQPAVFFGDNGQGDLVASQLMLIASQRLSPRRGAVLAAFVHDVQEPPACPSGGCRSAWARHNIFFFRDYAEATAIALDLGLISSRFAARILGTDAIGPSLVDTTEPGRRPRHLLSG